MSLFACRNRSVLPTALMGWATGKRKAAWLTLEFTTQMLFVPGAARNKSDFVGSSSEQEGDLSPAAAPEFRPYQ